MKIPRSFVRRGREGREGATLAIHPCNGCRVRATALEGPLPNATAILKQPNSSGTVQSCRAWANRRLHLLSHLLHLGPQSTWPDKGSPQWPCFNHFFSLHTLHNQLSSTLSISPGPNSLACHRPSDCPPPGKVWVTEPWSRIRFR